MCLPNLQWRELIEVPNSFLVLQCGSGPYSAFVAKLLHVDAPVFGSISRLYLFLEVITSCTCSLRLLHPALVSLGYYIQHSHLCKCTVLSAEKKWLSWIAGA
jgi:hypothetical protein